MLTVFDFVFVNGVRPIFFAVFSLDFLWDNSKEKKNNNDIKEKIAHLNGKKQITNSIRKSFQRLSDRSVRKRAKRFRGKRRSHTHTYNAHGRPLRAWPSAKQTIRRICMSRRRVRGSLSNVKICMFWRRVLTTVWQPKVRVKYVVA